IIVSSRSASPRSASCVTRNEVRPRLLRGLQVVPALSVPLPGSDLLVIRLHLRHNCSSRALHKARQRIFSLEGDDDRREGRKRGPPGAMSPVPAPAGPAAAGRAATKQAGCLRRGPADPPPRPPEPAPV